MEWGVHVVRPISPAEVGALEQAGVNVVTVPLSWRWMESAADRFDMAAIRHLLASFSGSSVRLQGLLGPVMPHALPQWLLDRGGIDVQEFGSFFARYCTRVVQELPEISLFRVEDELNAAHPWETLRTRRRRGRRWRDSSFRSELLLTACAAGRHARPDAALRVTLRAGVPGWQRELRSWLRQGLVVERIGVSMSPCSWLPDPSLGSRVGRAVEDARAAIAAQQYGALEQPCEIEVSRISYPTHRQMWTPRRQREFLGTSVAAARRSGASGFHWSSLRDQSYDDPSLGYWTPGRERHEGLLYYDGSPKPVMDEFRVVATGDRFGEGAATG